MHNMVSFAFYTDSYLGSSLPEKAFDSLAARAQEVLRRFERIYRVEGDAVSRDMAVCAMAETLADFDRRRGGITAETVGSVQRRYDDCPEKSLSRALYNKAAIYLDICRGVG